MALILWDTLYYTYALSQNIQVNGILNHRKWNIPPINKIN